MVLTVLFFRTPGEKLAQGRYDTASAEDRFLAFRALCDAVISLSAADEKSRPAALGELDDILRRAPEAASCGAPPLSDEQNRKVSGTPLYLAAALDCPEAATRLLDAGATLTGTPFDGVTPLEAAFKHNSRRVADLFVERVARLESGGERGNNPGRGERALGGALASPPQGAPGLLPEAIGGDDDDDVPGARAPVDDEAEENDDDPQGTPADNDRANHHHHRQSAALGETDATHDDQPERPVLERAWTHSSAEGHYDTRLRSVERPSPAARHTRQRAAA